METRLSDHAIGRVEERAHVLKDHKNLLDYLWSSGRPMISKDFLDLDLRRQPGRQYRLAVYHRQRVVIVRSDQGRYVTYIQIRG